MKARKNEDEVGRDAVYETTRIHACTHIRREMFRLQQEEREIFQSIFSVSQMRISVQRPITFSVTNIL